MDPGLKSVDGVKVGEAETTGMETRLLLGLKELTGALGTLGALDFTYGSPLSIVCL